MLECVIYYSRVSVLLSTNTLDYREEHIVIYIRLYPTFDRLAKTLRNSVDKALQAFNVSTPSYRWNYKLSEILLFNYMISIPSNMLRPSSAWQRFSRLLYLTVVVVSVNLYML